MYDFVEKPGDTNPTHKCEDINRIIEFINLFDKCYFSLNNIKAVYEKKDIDAMYKEFKKLSEYEHKYGNWLHAHEGYLIDNNSSPFFDGLTEGCCSLYVAFEQANYNPREIIDKIVQKEIDDGKTI